MQDRTPEFHQSQFSFGKPSLKLNPNAIDITYQRFGRLLAIKAIGRNERREILWLCQCDCGETCIAIVAKLKTHRTKSCGCHKKETPQVAEVKHGLSTHYMYSTWASMIQRCTNPKNPSYKNYGARGITIYEQWRHNFGAFYDYVTRLSSYGIKGYTMDRINNDGNYEPDNLRWATKTEQLLNSRRAIKRK